MVGHWRRPESPSIWTKTTRDLCVDRSDDYIAITVDGAPPEMPAFVCTKSGGGSRTADSDMDDAEDEYEEDMTAIFLATMSVTTIRVGCRRSSWAT